MKKFYLSLSLCGLHFLPLIKNFIFNFRLLTLSYGKHFIQKISHKGFIGTESYKNTRNHNVNTLILSFSSLDLFVLHDWLYFRKLMLEHAHNRKFSAYAFYSRYYCRILHVHVLVNRNGGHHIKNYFCFLYH
jgi:hypothetical protein